MQRILSRRRENKNERSPDFNRLTNISWGLDIQAFAMNRFFCLWASFVLIAMATPAYAGGDCPLFKTPTISIRPLERRTAYDNTHSLREMQGMARTDRDRYSSTDHEVPVGLTAATLKMDSRFEVVTHQAPNLPDVCGQIAHFELSFGFDDTTVFLARELPEGSCSYQTVLQHEHQHVDMDTYLVKTYTKLLPDLLQRAVTDIGMIRASSPGAAQDQMRELVKKYMNDLGRTLSEVRQRYQKTIDTRDEYSRISNSCSGELSAILRKSGVSR